MRPELSKLSKSLSSHGSVWHWTTFVFLKWQMLRFFLGFMDPNYVTFFRDGREKISRQLSQSWKLSQSHHFIVRRNKNQKNHHNSKVKVEIEKPHAVDKCAVWSLGTLLMIIHYFQPSPLQRHSLKWRLISNWYKILPTHELETGYDMMVRDDNGLSKYGETILTHCWMFICLTHPVVDIMKWFGKQAIEVDRAHAFYHT